MQQQISITEVSTFKKCRQQWDYSAYSRKYIRPAFPTFSMRRGRAYHEVIGWMFLNPLHSDDELYDRIRIAMIGHSLTNIDNEITIAFNILQEFKKFVSRHPLLTQIRPDNIISVEQRNVLPLQLDDKVVNFVYYCDLVVDLDNVRYIFDFKTSSRLNSNPDRSKFDDQATSYIMAESLKVDFEKRVIFVWVDLNTSKLQAPKLLKKGRYSRSKAQYLHMDQFIEAVKHSGQDYEFYADFIIEHTQRMFNRMFSVKMVYRSLAEIDNIHKELVMLADEMTSPDVKIYKAHYSTCRDCCYSDACHHNRFNGNEKSVLNVLARS